MSNTSSAGFVHQKVLKKQFQKSKLISKVQHNIFPVPLQVFIQFTPHSHAKLFPGNDKHLHKVWPGSKSYQYALITKQQGFRSVDAGIDNGINLWCELCPFTSSEILIWIAKKVRRSPTQQTLRNHSFCVLFWKNINCSMKSTVSYSSFRWKIINYFNYTSFVLETDKNFLVTSNNLFHSTKWRVKQRQSCRQRLLKPLKSTHTAKYLSFLQYPIMFITESSFLFEIGGAGVECDTAESPKSFLARFSTSRFWSMHPARILYVTSLNLHFGLMCTFICILENFKLFPRLRFTLSCFPSSETHQHFMCKWRKASSFADPPPLVPTAQRIVYDANWKLK